MRRVMEHYQIIETYPWNKMVTIGGRRCRLWRAPCKCGFAAEAYGKVLATNQLVGHIKTMQTIWSAMQRSTASPVETTPCSHDNEDMEPSS